MPCKQPCKQPCYEVSMPSRLRQDWLWSMSGGLHRRNTKVFEFHVLNPKGHKNTSMRYITTFMYRGSRHRGYYSSDKMAREYSLFAVAGCRKHQILENAFAVRQHVQCAKMLIYKCTSKIITTHRIIVCNYLQYSMGTSTWHCKKHRVRRNFEKWT